MASLLTLAIVPVALSSSLGMALASGAMSALAQTNPTPTVAANLSTSDVTKAPAPTSEAPKAVRTGVPAAVGTAGATLGTAPNAVETANASKNTSPGNPTKSSDNSSTSDVKPAPPATNATAASQAFPWLPVLVGLVVLLAIAAVLLAVTRRRRTVDVVSTGPSPRSTTTTTTTAWAAPAATVAPEAMAAAATGVAASTNVVCPNCGTPNSVDENFCHECGEDLRPVRAQMAAAAPPTDIVTDTTPYLETVDRLDEQLEYVLSRPRINVGTGPNNDIVFDSVFKGWQSVAPLHAELRMGGAGFSIVDLESSSGVFVNNSRTKEAVLSDGDTVRVGDVRFIYHVPS